MEGCGVFSSGVWVKEYFLITSSLVKRVLRELNPGFFFWNLWIHRDWWMTYIDEGPKQKAGTVCDGRVRMANSSAALMAVARM